MRINVELTTGSIIRSSEITESDLSQSEFLEFLGLIKNIGQTGNLQIPNDPTPWHEEQVTFVALSQVTSITLVDPLYQED